MASGIKLPYETSPLAIAKSRPISSALTLGIAPALSAAAGFAGNAASALFQPDRRSASEKGTEMTNLVQDRVGSGIGSSQGALRAGPPTSAGTVPIVSANFGLPTSKSIAPTVPAIARATPTAKPAPTTPAPKPAATAASKGKGKKPALDKKQVETPAVESEMPDRLLHVDPSVANTDIYPSFRDIPSGGGVGFIADKGAELADDMYMYRGDTTPEEIAWTQKALKDRENKYANQYDNLDFRSEDQKNWEKQRAEEQIMPLNPLFQGVPQHEKARADVINDRRRLDLTEKQLAQEGALSGGRLSLDKEKAMNDLMLGLGGQQLTARQIAIAESLSPWQIKGLQAEIASKGVDDAFKQWQMENTPNKKDTALAAQAARKDAEREKLYALAIKDGIFNPETYAALVQAFEAKDAGKSPVHVKGTEAIPGGWFGKDTPATPAGLEYVDPKRIASKEIVNQAIKKYGTNARAILAKHYDMTADGDRLN